MMMTTIVSTTMQANNWQNQTQIASKYEELVCDEITMLVPDFEDSLPFSRWFTDMDKG